MKSLIVLNGPNLNLLGTREPAVYGKQTLQDLQAKLDELAGQCGCRIEHRQSNAEGQIIDWIHEANEQADGIVLNAGAYSHYSYAIRDAVGSVSVPVVEVHLSNIHAREAFRSHSVLSPVVQGQIVGFGFLGYTLAVHALLEWAEEKGEDPIESNR